MREKACLGSLSQNTQFFLLPLLTIMKKDFINRLIEQCGNNSVVECNLAKVKVVGSNPISRSTVFFNMNYMFMFFFAREHA